jgi:hypothetical protein
VTGVTTARHTLRLHGITAGCPCASQRFVQPALNHAQSERRPASEPKGNSLQFSEASISLIRSSFYAARGRLGGTFSSARDRST